jgi:putative aminopeptidase FrvX
MLAGHMDEIGFIIHHIDEGGLLYFSPIGGHDAVVPIGQRLWVHGRERIPGVVGRKAVHLMSPGELSKKPEMGDLWIDIGASSRSEAAQTISIGDVVTFQYEYQSLAGSRACARAFDNKGGVFVVAEALRLLREQGGLHPDVCVSAVATVQEEIGSRGAKTAAFEIDAVTAIAVDLGQARDYPGVLEAEHGSLRLGDGPGIPCGPNTHPTVFSILCQAARDGGIPFQITVDPSVSPTDANALQVSRAGMATGLLEIPLRYMHTPSEVLDLRDVENGAKLLAAYCRAITPATSFLLW